MSVALAKVESWEDHVEAWHHLGRQVDGAAWGRAAIAASVGQKWGDVSRFAEEVGFPRTAVHDYARTFEAFPEVSNRLDTLTFTHHLDAIRYAGGTENAKAALGRAAREGWTSYALRKHLTSPKLPPAPDGAAEPHPPSESCDTEEGACGPVTPRDRMLHIALLMKGFNKIRDYDPEPLAQLGTKKSLKELSVQIGGVIQWLESFQMTIKGRL